MTTNPTIKTRLLERIDSGQASWEALLADVGEERMARPVAADDWTFKDVAAHLNAWREWTLARLAAGLKAETPLLPWPAGMEEESDEGTDEINAWFYERDRDRPLAAVLAESREQFRQMRSAVEALSAEDLHESDRFAWLAGYPLRAVVDGSFEHLEEHEQWIREWLAADESQASQEGEMRSTT